MITFTKEICGCWAVSSDGKLRGGLLEEGGKWQYTSVSNTDHKPLTASDLRSIADKLDQLNRETEQKG